MNETPITHAATETDSDADRLDRRSALLALLASLGLADQATAQDAAAVQPQAYRVALDNPQLRVLEFNSKPGMGVCGSGMHSHPAHLTVLLSAGKFRLRTPDGKVQVGESKLGDVFWSEAETHEVENILGRDMRTLLIELKPQAPAKS